MANMLNLPNDIFHSYMIQGLENYILHGIPPGRYTECLLTGNLYGIVGAADHLNRNKVYDQAEWIAQNLPVMMYGSVEKYRDWINDKDNLRSKYRETVETNHMWRILQGKETTVVNDPPF